MILIVDKKCTTMRYSAGVVTLQREGEATRNIAVSMLEQVIVYGNTLVESAVYRALAAAGVPATLLPASGTQATAYLSAGLATQLPARKAQHRCAGLPLARLTLAKEIVLSKLQGYQLPLTLLMSMGVNEDEINQFIARCFETEERLADAKSIASILGMEGSIAQLWFVLISRAVPIDFKFTGRNRRPPRDPVNALLSLGYTLLHAEVLRAVHAAGMDPSLGFLHSDYPGRSSLVLDMCEPLRSGVDFMVLRLIAEGVITPEHFFYRSQTGCRLSKKARPVFFQAWANQRNQWPRPVNVEQAYPWPCANISEVANGQLQKLRKLLHENDSQASTEEEIVNPIKFEELEDDSA